MSKLIGLNGKPLVRQEARELERDISKNISKVIPGIIRDIQFLAQRSDVIIEALKGLGVTDEQFTEAADRVKAKYEEVAEIAN